MSGLWQTGERTYPESSKQELVQVAGVNIKLSQLNLRGIPSWNASVLTAHLGFPFLGSDSLQDPHCRIPSWVCSLLGHPTDILGAVCPLWSSFLPRQEGWKESSFPASILHPCPSFLMSWTLASLWPTVPKKYLLPVFLARPPEASFFMNKIWAVLEPWGEETTASAFYCCGCWCLWPHWQEQRREERAQGVSAVTLQCELCCLEPILRNSWLCNTLFQAVCN